MDTTFNKTDDSLDAMVFIAVVLIWYSLAHVFLLLIETGNDDDDDVEYTTKFFTVKNREQEKHQKTLRALVDPEQRNRLWKIYLGESKLNDERIHRAEIFRLRNIERQLTLNPYDEETSAMENMTDLSTFINNQRSRRRSSLDYQILNEWKTISDRVRKHEMWPWAIQRILLRQHFRRQRCQSERTDSKDEQI